MRDKQKIKKLVELVILNTVEKNIPTLVLLSEIDEADFMKSVISAILQKEYNENEFTPEDWNELADVMLRLGNIPLVIKMIDSVEKTLKQIKDFSTELNDNKGYVVIEYENNNFSDLNDKKNIVVEII